MSLSTSVQAKPPETPCPLRLEIIHSQQAGVVLNMINFETGQLFDPEFERRFGQGAIGTWRNFAVTTVTK